VIAVVAADPNRPRPPFNGGRHGRTLLDGTSATGKRTSLVISGVEIADYEPAIYLAGDRAHREQSNGRNEIRDNGFLHIGKIAPAGALPSTAVLRLVNSDDNVIAGNCFIRIVNVEICAQLRFNYVTHGSADNMIEKNVFESSCGDAIRFRDRSDSNIVRNNSFIDSWAKAPISNRYCDREKWTDCTKSTPQCPSMNNVLDGNKVVSRKLAPA
jgi:parallel beta-helix repeat protein